MKKITSLIMLFSFTLVLSIEAGENTVKYNPVANPAKIERSGKPTLSSIIIPKKGIGIVKNP